MKHAFLTHGISKKKKISKAAKKKQLGAQDKSTGPKANVLADLDPATQKLNEQVFMPKRGEEKV